MRRRAMGNRENRRVFRGNSGTHHKNTDPRPMRGGIRL